MATRTQPDRKSGGVVTGVWERARSPLLALVGVSDLATKSMREARDRLNRPELRKTADSYASSAARFYADLVNRGESTVDRLRTQPQVKRALEQADVARQRADDVLDRVTFRTRSTGEKAARTAEKVSNEAAEKVSATGQEAASATRSATQKAAANTSQARRSTTSTSTSTDN